MTAPAVAFPSDLRAFWTVGCTAGWTWVELNEMNLSLTRAGIQADTEFGITDDGAPWVILSLDTQAVRSAIILCNNDGYLVGWVGSTQLIEVEDLHDALASLCQTALIASSH